MKGAEVESVADQSHAGNMGGAAYLKALQTASPRVCMCAGGGGSYMPRVCFHLHEVVNSDTAELM